MIDNSEANITDCINEQITREGIGFAIKIFQNSKAAGYDGVPTENCVDQMNGSEVK